MAAGAVPPAHDPERGRTAFNVLVAIGFSHLLNDLIQSLIPALYPLLKDSLSLSFSQIGLITLAFQVTASLLQPVVGLYTDRHPQPYSLSIGIGCTLIGLLVLAFAPSYGMLLTAAAMVGTGSSVFHPESSRVARMASGGRYGLAQSIFQVGGNAGSALGPLLAALIVIPHGQHSIAWFALRRASRHGSALEGGRLVQLPPAAGDPAEAGGRPRAGDPPPHPDPIGRRLAGAAVFEEFLHGQHHQLLHVLPHHQIRRVRAFGPDAPLRVLVRGGAWGRCSAGTSATGSAAGR